MALSSPANMATACYAKWQDRRRRIERESNVQREPAAYGTDFATSSVSSKHQLMAAWVGIRVPLWPSRAILPGSLLALRYLLLLPLVFIRRRVGSSICEGSKREPFRTRIYWFFQMS